jgi:hypothetical protein
LIECVKVVPIGPIGTIQLLMTFQPDDKHMSNPDESRESDSKRVNIFAPGTRRMAQIQFAIRALTPCLNLAIQLACGTGPFATIICTEET